MPRVTLGRVAGVFGIRGWVKVLSYTRPLENLLDYEPWWIAKGEGFEARLIESRLQGRGIVAHICGADGQPITDRDVAASLIGSEIQVDRAAMPEPPPGQVYWADLVGLKVRNLESVELGQVESVTSNGAQDVLVIRQGETERLIPLVRGPIIHSVSVEEGLIVADWQPDY